MRQASGETNEHIMWGMSLVDAMQWELVFWGRLYNPELGLILLRNARNTKVSARKYL